mgnify:CR=1 FL=1
MGTTILNQVLLYGFMSIMGLILSVLVFCLIMDIKGNFNDK